MNLSSNVLNAVSSHHPSCKFFTIIFSFTFHFSVTGSQTENNGNCYRVLETEHEGWPDYGRLCDAVDVIKNPDRSEKKKEIESQGD